MARTLCAGISNQAKDQFYRDNQDIIPQVEWLDTLDGRTCPSCAGLSRKRYNTEEPHPVPPLHPQCRCVLLPVTELTDLGEDVPRAAANADFDAEAKRMYEEKYPQKHFEDLAPSTREQYRHKAIHEYEDRTGKPAFTRAPGSMTFAEFFEQSSEQFKKDWLKPGKYSLYKSGKYPITAFIPPHPDRAFGVKQLKEMDIDSFRHKVGNDKNKKDAIAKPPKTKEDFCREHLTKRQKQWNEAFDNRRDAWIEEMRATGVDDSVISVLADIYTPEMAKLGKPPMIKLTDQDKAYYSHNWGDNKKIHRGTIVLNRNPQTWYGHPVTAVHEFGHWFDHYTRFRNIRYNSGMNAYIAAGQDFVKASNADWDKLKKQNRGFLAYFNETEYFDIVKQRMEGGYWKEIREKLFGKKVDLDLRERKIIRQYQDTIGSITKGRYGGGHSVSYYRDEVGNLEAFAQSFSAYVRNDDVFRLAFPDMWSYIDNIMKDLKK